MDAVKILGSLLSSNATGGSMLGKLLGGAAGGGGGGQAGGIGSLLGALTGGGGGGGGASGLVGMLAKGALGAGGGGMLGSLLGGGSEPASAAAPEPSPAEANDQATVLIRAMCNAAKADGQIDEEEQKNIIGKLGDIDQSEADFLRQEFSSPLDVQGFAASVPSALASQVYALSCATVRVDTQEEVAYLQELGQALRLDGDTLNGIHKQLGLA